MYVHKIKTPGFRICAMLMAVVCLCLSLVACKSEEEEAPDDMMICNMAGDPYRLFIPETWNTNTASGVTSAYASMTYLSTVSVVAYPPLSEQESLEDFRLRILDGMMGVYSEWNPGEPVESVMGTANAIRFESTGKRDGESFRILCKAALYEGQFYLFTYYATDATYETYLPDVENMLDVFRFDTPYVPTGKETENFSAPGINGMKLLSGSNMPYFFYVPETWIKAPGSLDVAYCSEEDKTNISMMLYNPSGEISAAEYFALCETEYKKQYTDYACSVNGEETTMGGKKALKYIFTGKIGDVTYQTEQIVTVGGSFLTGMTICVMTYTAEAEKFDAHLPDLQDCIDAFAFR